MNYSKKGDNKMNSAMKIFACILHVSLMYGASIEVMSPYEIIKIDSITKAMERIKSYAGEESLYLVDLDDNVFIPGDPYLRNANSDARYEHMKELKLDSESLYWQTALYQTAKYQLMDGAWPKLIDNLKGKKATVYGCTARSIGSLFDDESSEEFTHRTAQNLNIPFDQHEIDLDLFKYGILFCGKYVKGTAVKKLLEKTEKKFETIVMIDDRDYNLKSVGQAVQQWNMQKKQAKQAKQAIKFVGFHYTAVEHMDHTFDDKVVKCQLEYLIKHIDNKFLDL